MPKSGNIHVLLPKISFEKSKLLSYSQYRDLITSKDLNEFISKLRRTEYGKMQFYEAITLNIIEFELKEIFFSVIQKIITNAPKSFQKFFLSYLLKYEIENVKTLIRGFSKNLKKEELQLYYTVETILGRKKLLSESLIAPDLKSLIQILQNLPYGGIIREIFEIIQREKYSFFYLDILLDLKYLEELWVSHQKLSRKNKQIIEKFIGLEIDCYNIQTVLRAKLLELEEHLIYRMVSQQYYHLNQKFLENLIKNKLDLEKFLKFLKSKEKFNYNLENPEDIRHLCRKKVLSLIHSFYIRPGFNIGKPFAFLLNKELEIENLRTISIGIYYKKSSEEILNRIYII